MAGRIVQLLVREGDRVAAGQPLARIDDAPLVDQAKEASAVLARVGAERRNAEATRARVQRVFEHGIAARQEVDDAVTRADTARAAEAEADSAAKRARRQVERATVRSPLEGVVVRVLRRPGELVDGTPATPILEVANPEKLELVADVPAANLVRVARGAEATVRVPALPTAAWTGMVSAVSPAVDRATGLGTVRVSIVRPGPPTGAAKSPKPAADPSGAAEPPRPPIGVLGVARIVTGRPRPALAVPARALRAGVGDEAEIVLCGGDGLAHVRRVRRGSAAGDFVEISGLAAGDQVALDPLGLGDGAPIEIQR